MKTKYFLRKAKKIALCINDNWKARYSDKPRLPDFYTLGFPSLLALIELERASSSQQLEILKNLLTTFLYRMESWKGKDAKAFKEQLHQLRSEIVNLP